MDKEKKDIWQDENFVMEMNIRLKDFEESGEQGISWDELKVKARSAEFVHKPLK